MFKVDVAYVYTKLLKEFGRPFEFDSSDAEWLYDFPHSADLEAKYIKMKPCPAFTQTPKDMSAREIITEKTNYKRKNINHEEGGYPKEVNFADADHVMRYKKKLEKDEKLLAKLPNLCKQVEACVFQNTASNIYQVYYTDNKYTCDFSNTPRFMRNVNRYQDPWPVKRPVSDIAWAPDGIAKMATAHANLGFQACDITKNTYSYIWSLVYPSFPESALDAGFACTRIRFNPRDEHVVIGGLVNGQMALWDVRTGIKPEIMSPLYYSFRDPVSSLIYIASKSGNEVMSGSTDGQIIWWDVRMMAEGPLERVIVDFTKGDEQIVSRSMGITCLEYEATIPTKFMAGTEGGLILSGNKKGKSMNEKFGTIFSGHKGPIKMVQRNPYCLKNFLTIGDWTIRMWSEDCKESCILWSNYQRIPYTSAGWSPSKFPVFYAGMSNGVVQIWDFTHRLSTEVFTQRICDDILRCISPHEDGNLVAVGADDGCTYVTEVSSHFSEPQKTDKVYLQTVFERETHREKLIEGKMREMRLKARGGGDEDKAKEEEMARIRKENAIKEAEELFHSTIQKMKDPEFGKKKDEDYN